VSRFVLDASIVLAWCFPDEDDSVAAYSARRLQKGDGALAPSFWPHEVLNALLAGEKRRRISPDLVESFLTDLAALPVELAQFPARMVFERIKSLSRRHGLSAYDAAYLDLALESGLPLATLDGDLVRACRRTGTPLVRP